MNEISTHRSSNFISPFFAAWINTVAPVHYSFFVKKQLTADPSSRLIIHSPSETNHIHIISILIPIIISSLYTMAATTTTATTTCNSASPLKKRKVNDGLLMGKSASHPIAILEEDKDAQQANEEKETTHTATTTLTETTDAPANTKETTPTTIPRMASPSVPAAAFRTMMIAPSTTTAARPTTTRILRPMMLSSPPVSSPSTRAMYHWSLHTLQHFRQTNVGPTPLPSGISVLHVQKLLGSIDYCLAQEVSPEKTATLLEHFYQAVQHCQARLYASNVTMKDLVAEIQTTTTTSTTALVRAVKCWQHSILQSHKLYHARILLLVLAREGSKYGLLFPAYQSAMLEMSCANGVPMNNSNTPLSPSDPQGTSRMIAQFDQGLAALWRVMAHACRFHASRVLQNDRNMAKALGKLLAVIRACWNTLVHEWPLLDSSSLDPAISQSFQLCAMHLRKFLVEAAEYKQKQQQQAHHKRTTAIPSIIDLASDEDDDEDSSSKPESTKHDSSYHNERKRKYEVTTTYNEDPRWEHRLQLLREYREEHGHCKVPYNYLVDGVALGLWVANQRKARKAMQDGKAGAYHKKMTPERIAALDKVGFLWKIQASHKSPVKEAK